MWVSQLVGSMGRAEGLGNDAVLKGSQEAPLEKHLKEARQEECSRRREQPRQFREPHCSLGHTHASWTKNEGETRWKLP